MKTTTNKKKAKTVVEKIRAFRNEFTIDYLKRHKRINMADFTAAFLHKAYPKKA